MSDEELKKRVEEVKDYLYPQPSEIGADFFDISAKMNKSKVIFNQDEKFSYTSSEEIVYNLKEPVFIERLVFETDSKMKDSNIVFWLANGERQAYLIEESLQRFEIPINHIVVGIQFELPKGFLKRQRLILKKIEFYGRTIQDINALKTNSEKIQTLYQELQTLATEVMSKNTKILEQTQKAKTDLEATHQELTEKIGLLTTQHDELTDDRKIKLEGMIELEASLNEMKETLALKQRAYDDLVKKELLLNNSIEEKTSTLKELNIKIAQEEGKLKDLQKDTTLIAYDVQGFIENAQNNIKIYIGLSALPWILICFATYLLFTNTEVLASIYKLGKDDVDLTTIFWSRMPFAIILSSIVYVSYEISISFANKIIDLHQRILDLQKIGIIARDVSEASLTNLEGFTDEEKYELRTKLKMDLLRSHLAKDFDKPEPFKVSNPSLFSRFELAKKAFFGMQDENPVKDASSEPKTETKES